MRTFTLYIVYTIIFLFILWLMNSVSIVSGRMGRGKGGEVGQNEGGFPRFIYLNRIFYGRCFSPLCRNENTLQIAYPSPCAVKMLIQHHNRKPCHTNIGRKNNLNLPENIKVSRAKLCRKNSLQFPRKKKYVKKII